MLPGLYCAIAGSSAAPGTIIPDGAILTTGDMQDGADVILVSGDMQTGTDNEQSSTVA